MLLFLDWALALTLALILVQTVALALTLALPLVLALTLVLALILVLAQALALILVLVAPQSVAALRLQRALNLLTQHRACLHRFGMLLLNQNTTTPLDCRMKFRMSSSWHHSNT